MSNFYIRIRTVITTLSKRKIALDYTVAHKLKITYLHLIFAPNVVFFYKLSTARIHNPCDKGTLKRLEEKKANGSTDNLLQIAEAFGFSITQPNLIDDCKNKNFPIIFDQQDCRNSCQTTY